MQVHEIHLKTIYKKTRKRAKNKPQRKYLHLYNALLAQVEDLGIISIDFNSSFSYKQKIKILNNIIRNERGN